MAKLSLDLRAAVDADDGAGPYHVVVHTEPGAEHHVGRQLDVEPHPRSSTLIAVVSYEVLSKLSVDEGVRLIALSDYLVALADAHAVRPTTARSSRAMQHPDQPQVSVGF